MDLKSLRGNPSVRLTGNVDNMMLDRFFGAVDALLGGENDPPAALLLEMSTQGGDADLGERLAEEIRLLRTCYGIDCLFLGNTFVYSAGVTVMSAFPVEKRFLTQNTTLLIHQRRMDLQVHLCGPLRSKAPEVLELLAQIESGQAIQERGFARLVEGTGISLDEILERTRSNWYLTAEEALSRRLVAALF